MFYIGIDIGKRNHVGKTISFANSKDGSDKLLQFINQYKLTLGHALVGLEATGHTGCLLFLFFIN